MEVTKGKKNSTDLNELLGQKFLLLNSLHIFAVNLKLLWFPAKYLSHFFTHHRAVDGHLGTTVVSSTGCARTKQQRPAWWTVDLGAKFFITSVTITSKEGTGSDIFLFHVVMISLSVLWAMAKQKKTFSKNVSQWCPHKGLILQRQYGLWQFGVVFFSWCHLLDFDSRT